MYLKIATYLCNIASDKLIHLLACLLLTFILGQTFHLFNLGGLFICSLLGAIIIFCVGLLKEVYDSFKKGNKFDKVDILYDIIGCLLGFLVTTI